MSVRLAGPHTPHVPTPPYRLRLLRREGGSDLLPDEYATLDAAARAVPEGGFADVVDAEGCHVAMATKEPDGVHITLPRLDLLGKPARVIVESGGLASIMGKWPGDETDEEIQQALQELNGLDWRPVLDCLRERFPAEAANDTNPVETVLRLLERLWRWEH